MGLPRARSESAKRARQQSILLTANQLLRDHGFNAFTMHNLAKATGLAKGTLYLYFTTREELLLALFVDLNDDWISRFLISEKRIATPDYGDTCLRFYESFVVDGLLVDLAARVATGVEPFVPNSAWVAAKQAHARTVKRIAGMFYQVFGSEPLQAQRLAWAFIAALSGAQQRAVFLDDRTELPQDVLDLSRHMSSKDVFLNMVLPLIPRANSSVRGISEL